MVQDVLRAHLPRDVRVWVFGSHANWTTKDSSDLDLALEGATRVEHRTISALAAAFEESDLPYTVDVVDLNAVSRNFKKIVEDQRIPLPSKRRTMTERLHLAPKHRAQIEALLREHLPDVEVWAYGSRVNGRSHDGSDLDLVLRGPGLKEIPVGKLVDFEEAVREIHHPLPGGSSRLGTPAGALSSRGGAGTMWCWLMETTSSPVPCKFARRVDQRCGEGRNLVIVQLWCGTPFRPPIAEKCLTSALSTSAKAHYPS